MRKVTPIILLLQLSCCTIIAKENSLYTREIEDSFCTEERDGLFDRNCQGTVDSPEGQIHINVDNVTRCSPGQIIDVRDESYRSYSVLLSAKTSICAPPEANHTSMDEEKCPRVIDSEESIFNLLMFLLTLLLNVFWWLDNGES